MSHLFSDPTDDMPFTDLSRTVDRRLLAAIAIVLVCQVAMFMLGVAYGRVDQRQRTIPVACTPVVVDTLRVPTVWPRGPVAGARP